MARISGIEIQDKWRVVYALTRIKGVGWTTSKRIAKELGFDEAMRVKDLSNDDISKITAKFEEFPTEGELVRLVRGNIQRLQAIGSYRGMRHSRSLPVRGQRTKTNARTKRGKRKTIGAFKKEALAKTAQASTAKK